MSKLTWEEHLAKQAGMRRNRYKQRHYQITRQTLNPRTIKSPVLYTHCNLQHFSTAFSTCYTQTQTSHCTEEQDVTGLVFFSFLMLKKQNKSWISLPHHRARERDPCCKVFLPGLWYPWGTALQPGCELQQLLAKSPPGPSFAFQASLRVHGSETCIWFLSS